MHAYTRVCTYLCNVHRGQRYQIPLTWSYRCLELPEHRPSASTLGTLHHWAISLVPMVP